MSDLPPRAGESDVSNLVDVGEGRPRPAWRVEQNRDWGWCVRNGVFTKSGITGKSEEGYVAFRLKDKATAELIARAPALSGQLAAREEALRQIGALPTKWRCLSLDFPVDGPTLYPGVLMACASDLDALLAQYNGEGEA